eukprot:GHVS01074663.1.p1 GENE.GHVS01074663.1~~GHVS01074663.1.p1  ORF type:complete len:330 (-),score=63.79 GHVS01074663.1:195-1184(-)
MDKPKMDGCCAVTTTATTSTVGAVCSSVLCPRRRHFLTPYPMAGNGAVVVLPSRHCVTADGRRSVEAEVYGESLRVFADTVFSLPTTTVWEPIELKSDLFNKVTRPHEVSTSSVSAWRYPQHLLEGAEGLPLCLLEWDWTSATPQEAFSQMRHNYFNPTYVDDESDYQLVEKLPKFKHSSLQSALVFRAVWRAPPVFTTRDWVEFICADPTTYSVLSRSCIHPQFSDIPPLNSLAKWMAAVLPAVGILRAQSCFCVRFNKPKPNATGTTMQLCIWYKMNGLPDWLCKLTRKIEREYMRATLRMFNQMAQVNEQIKQDENSVEKQAFDLT